MNKCGKEIEQEQKNIYKFIYKFSKIYLVIASLLTIMTFLVPLSGKERKLPLLCYDLGNFLQTPIYQLVYMWQIICVIFITPFFTGVIILFFCLIGFCYCQTIMLKHAFMNIDFSNVEDKENEENAFQELKNYVDFHNRLIK